MNELEIFKKKLIYRSNYRGTKEMDILLSGFVKKYIDILSENELMDLYEILKKDDDVIFKWYSNNNYSKEIPENRVSKLLKDFKLN